MSHRILGALAALAQVCAQAQTGSGVRAFQVPFLKGSALLGFRGTALQPGASGQASLRARGGAMAVHAHFRGLGPADRLGPPYLTYVLWALSPSGQALNLGEVAPVRGRAHLETLVPFRSFALMVTAEPHFAVTRVSRAVALENEALPEGRSNLVPAEVRIEALERGDYLPVAPEGTDPGDGKASPYLLQARNAVLIAQAEGAEGAAPEAFRTAREGLARLETEPSRGDAAVLLALDTTVQAEEARLAAAKGLAAVRLAEEKERAAHALLALRKAEGRLEALRLERGAEDAGGLEARVRLRRSLLERLGAVLHTRETGEGLLATLTEGAFPPGSDRLTNPARERLARVSDILLGRPGLRIRITGHTDGTGASARNARLSRARAEAARRFLQDRGIPSGALEADGASDTAPLTSERTPHGRSLNRRVDLMVRGEAIGM
jgi:outer membrane protein OmpA-like peptidoglycan-associated protein